MIWSNQDAKEDDTNNQKKPYKRNTTSTTTTITTPPPTTITTTTTTTTPTPTTTTTITTTTNTTTITTTVSTIITTTIADADSSVVKNESDCVDIGVIVESSNHDTLSSVPLSRAKLVGYFESSGDHIWYVSWNQTEKCWFKIDSYYGIHKFAKLNLELNCFHIVVWKIKY